MAAADKEPDSTHPTLIEGEDYYIENGRWVFTEVYHRRRGKCCKSGCRHCPYGFEAKSGKMTGKEDRS